MNTTIVMLTARALFGGKRALLLLAMSLLLLALATTLRFTVAMEHQATADFLSSVALGALVPLFGLIVGTGVISPEIDDGSIIYLLAKPISRPTIALSKFIVAVAATVVFGAVPTFLAGLIISGAAAQIAIGFGVGAVVSSVAYSAVFLLLGIVTRHAVVLGLCYALIWEGLVGGFVPGARTLSIQQWALSVTESITEQGIVTADVQLAVAWALLAVVIVAATWYAGQRLRVLSLIGEE
jgi:ABC-2 type transport system permease protein